MIGKLNRALTIEIVFVAAFIGLAFRSVVAMLASILPGIFPILVSGTVLWIMGQGLQFASIVALTVSFGLGLSATIHFLNRLRLEDKPGEDPAVAVYKATVLAGPAVILTSVVLACGLVVTVVSDLPSLRMFGWLSAFAFSTENWGRPRKEVDALLRLLGRVINREINALREARGLGIPTVALIDTDGDSDLIDLPIPGNDDSSKAVTLYARGIADAILEGRANAVAEVAKAATEGDDEFVEVEDGASA